MIPTTMQGVYLIGHGGFEKLQYRHDIPVPAPLANEVLIRVGAAAVNNTDINTRIAWYSKNITGETNAGAADGFGTASDQDASWTGSALGFPLIQGADCCGIVVAVGREVDSARLGERVITRTMQSQATEDAPYSCVTLGSERDGGFAQYMTSPSHHALKVECDWTDIELASIPCAYTTAEGMLHRSNVVSETVLITGASGGVGSAAIQLAKRRGANVVALCSEAKADNVRALGADKVIFRNCDFVETLGNESIDVVVDLVAGTSWPSLLEVLKRGGRYVTAGAIAGPIVELDVRTLYLKDLTLFGCTYQDNEILVNLVTYIERGDIRPIVAKSYPLEQIVAAQKDFMTKKYTGKLVLVPPQE